MTPHCAVGMTRSAPETHWQVAGLDVQVRRSARRRTLA
ncbi:MAG TPA: M48 family peptidase, partial [Deinococcus radiodurans]|nr:M48 family peptidase [Deinococcus radiodurans]